MPFIDGVKAAGATLALLGAAYGVGDQIGWRPMWKWEGERMGLYLTRQRLIDRIEDNTVTPFQRGVLSGICMALQIKPVDCEKRDQ